MLISFEYLTIRSQKIFSLIIYFAKISCSGHSKYEQSLFVLNEHLNAKESKVSCHLPGVVIHDVHISMYLIYTQFLDKTLALALNCIITSWYKIITGETSNGGGGKGVINPPPKKIKRIGRSCLYDIMITPAPPPNELLILH